MELQIFYLQLAIYIYGVLSGFSNGAEDNFSTENDHYDKAHPLALNRSHFSVHSIELHWSMPENMENYTSHLFNFIIYHHKRIDRGKIGKLKVLTRSRKQAIKRRMMDYNVHWGRDAEPSGNRHAFDTNEYINATVPANETSYKIEGLEAGTKYSFYIEANYSTGHRPASHTFTYLTMGYGPDNPCPCQSIGSLNNNCNRTTGWCVCRGPGYADKRCEACIKGFYWHTKLGCQKCPKCNMQRSDGTCYIDQTRSNQVLCRCHSPWGGAICNHCGVGYFMGASGSCEQCQCNNNTADKTNLCHYKTGACEPCKYNTTGDNCERCLPGYEGDAVKGRNCTLYTPSEAHNHKGGVIVGVCVALFIVVIIVISVGICRRVRGRKPKFNFWTVELKDDHEQVNFSQMMEQNDYNNGDLYMDDVLQYHDRAAVPATTPTHERPPLYRPNRPKMQGPYQTLEDRHREIC